MMPILCLYSASITWITHMNSECGFTETAISRSHIFYYFPLLFCFVWVLFLLLACCWSSYSHISLPIGRTTRNVTIARKKVQSVAWFRFHTYLLDVRMGGRAEHRDMHSISSAINVLVLLLQTAICFYCCRECFSVDAWWWIISAILHFSVMCLN